MADGMGLPALSLRTDYIDASPLNAFRTGQEDLRADNQRNLLKEVGGLASSGNYLEAARAAMKGGDVKTGMDIQNWDLDRRKSAYQFLVDGVQRADTPEKYQTLVDMVSRNFGPEMVRGYESWDKRPSAITALQKAELAFKQQEFASQHAARMAQAELHRAQAEAARRKSPDLMETLRAIDQFGRPAAAAPQQSSSVGVPPAGGAGQTGPLPGGAPADSSVPGIVVDNSSPVSAQPRPASPAPVGQSASESEPGLVSRLPRDKQAALALAIQKGDMTEAGKIVSGGGEIEDKLRKEHEGLVKTYREAQSGVEQLNAAYLANSSIGDLAMVYALMKALDPGSVVRESEYGFVVNSQSIPQALVQRINQFWDPQGKRLSASIREQMVDYGEAAIAKRKQEYDRLTGQLQSIAKSRGANPSHATIDAASPEIKRPANPRLEQLGGGFGAAGGTLNPEADKILREAREAIKNGKDRNAVIERLKQMNVDPRGL